MSLKSLLEKATGKRLILEGDALIIETRIKDGVERMVITRGLSSGEGALIVALHNCAKELLAVRDRAEVIAKEHLDEHPWGCDCALCAALAALKEKEAATCR